MNALQNYRGIVKDNYNLPRDILCLLGRKLCVAKVPL